MVPKLTMIPGSKEAHEVTLKRLAERAFVLGHQWAHHEIGVNGERKLIEAFKGVFPGLSENVIKAVAPAILTELGHKVATLEIGEEGINLLAHILENHPSKPTQYSHHLEILSEIQTIKLELKNISTKWQAKTSNGGNYIDIIGQPHQPTSVKITEETVTPEYHEVNVATIYLEEPSGELELNAKFIAEAPNRIERLIDFIEGELKK